jgi:hypothetical protein
MANSAPQRYEAGMQGVWKLEMLAYPEKCKAGPVPLCEVAPRSIRTAADPLQLLTS